MENVPSKKQRSWKKRYVVMFMIFLVCVTTQLQRLNLSFALVDMANSTKKHVASENATECAFFNNKADFKEKKNAEFSWDSKLQGLILSSTYFGYCLTQLPGGLLSERLGVKKLILMTTISGAVCNLISPITARTNPYLFFVVHFVKGLGMGTAIAGIQLASARWFPKPEKGFLSAFMLSGYAFGGVLGSAISGPLCEIEFDNGWPLVFYAAGILGMLASFLIIILYYENPADDPNISEEELKYILENTTCLSAAERPPIPWRAILTCAPTYAFIFALFGQYWMMFYFLTVHPFYMDSILNIPVKENGLLTSGPQFAQGIASLTACLFSFWINKIDSSRINLARKGCNSMAVITFLIGIGGIYLSGCDIFWNEFFLFLTSAAPGFGMGGVVIAAVDMTPAYCGSLAGLASTIASLSGFIIPLLTSKVLEYEQTMVQWHKMLLITALIATMDGVVFLIWGSTEIQPYDPSFKKEKRQLAPTEVTSTHL